ncbi:tetratricopeptide repeat protein [Singulisphaera sp. PoT]|uniref:tetratricopeptide repeat protein n=1 Tax=Singulisphaera sp. PoT TaxID=3411797 RepID=UPI003BF5B432
MHHRVTQDPALSKIVRIAWLLEDETITSFVQLLKRIYELLAEAYPDEFPLDWLEDLLDCSPARILKSLETCLVEKFQGKTLLLFVENLDLIFDGMGDEGQKQWRSFLQTHPLTSIVATSQRLFKSVRNRQQPFFGFFTTDHLKPLQTLDAVDLLRRIARHRQQADLLAFLETPEGRSRVRAIHHLAGGNHRIYIVLSGFITRDSLDELAGPFEKMADELTPYYQERMRWLSPQQRQIVEYLCSRDETCTPKEIARHLLATENTVGGQLKKLAELGYVLRSPRGRETRYELAEPLMRLASEVKEKRRKPLRLLVNFLRVWYRPEVLPRLLDRASTPSLRMHLQAAISISNSTPDPHLKVLEEEIANAKEGNRLDLLYQVLEERAHARGTALDWHELGYCHNALENFGEAVISFEKAIEIDPNNASPWVSKGDALAGLGRHEDAILCFDKAIEIDPNDDSAWASKGDALAGLGRREDAILCFDKAIEIDPNYAFPWSGKGRALADLGRREDAILCFDKAIELGPNYAFPWSGKGRALADLGRREDAILCFDKAIELGPNYASPWVGKCRALAGLGRREDAILCFDKAIEIDPNDDFAWVSKGNALADLGRREDAILCFDKAIEIDPNDDFAWVSKGRALADLGRREDAILCFDKAIEIDPNDDFAWVSKGRALADLGRREDAILCFDKAIEIDPNDDFAWVSKGRALAGLGRREDAILCFDKAIEIDPNYDSAWSSKGHVLSDLGRREDAILCFDKAIEIDPNDDFAWVSKGNALAGLGRREDAILCFDKAIEIDPNYAFPWSGKGRALADLGRREDAILCFDKAIELGPNYAFPWSGKGRALADLGRREDAILCFDKAIEIDPNDDFAWVSKGNALAGLGRREDAILCFDKAIELGPNNAFAWSGKGHVLSDLGRREDAILCFDKAIETNPGGDYAWLIKSDVLEDLGRREEAIECLDQALKIDPQHAYAWFNKARILAKLGQHEAACECHEKTLKFASTKQEWCFLGCCSRFAMRGWEAGFEALRNSFGRYPRDTRHNVGAIIIQILELSEREDLRQHLAELIAIYKEAGVLSHLGDGLVRSLHIEPGQVDGEVLACWREAWLDLGAGYAELEVPLRMFGVGIEYLIHGDKKILLDLVSVERKVLQQALGLDPNENDE